MVFAQDLLTRIINIQMETGLAVEFTHRPDYLTMNRALSTNKVVMSFWFRIPSETVTLVRATAPSALQGGGYWGHQVFLTVIPLVVWGEQQMTTVTDFESHDTGAVDVSGSIIFVQREVGSHSEAVQPSGIGVRVGVTDNPWEPPVLDVHIQTDVHATGSNLHSVPTGFTGTFLGISQTPGDPSFGKPIYAHVEYVMTDYTHTVTAEPEYFGNSVPGRNTGYPEIGEPDQWHHLLISWEIVSHSNASGASKMWCAIDDVNKAGDDLPAINDSSFDDMGPNDHLTYTTWSYKGNDDNASVNVIFEDDNVPSNPFQIPAPPTVQYATDPTGGKNTFNPIERVELAELQIFSGVTLDTSKVVNRRAFIDFERDADGKPIEHDGKRTLKPVNPEQAEKLLGKKPEILLHESAKWQHGINTGSLGFDTAGEETPAGQFKPTGAITKYKPDPSIEV